MTQRKRNALEGETMTAIWEMVNGDWQHVMHCDESRASTMHTLIRKNEPHKMFKVSKVKPKPVY